jgi:hypothetical protein
MAPAKKPTSKERAASPQATSGRKYSPKSSAYVEEEMREMKQGKLRLRNGEPVTNPKQAIAIGLAEARRAGAQQPPPPKESAPAAKKKKSAVKKAAGSAAKQTATKAGAKKAAEKRVSPARKTAPSASKTKGAAAKRKSS